MGGRAWASLAPRPSTESASVAFSPLQATHSWVRGYTQACVPLLTESSSHNVVNTQLGERLHTRLRPTAHRVQFPYREQHTAGWEATHMLASHCSPSPVPIPLATHSWVRGYTHACVPLLTESSSHTASNTQLGGRLHTCLHPTAHRVQFPYREQHTAG